MCKNELRGNNEIFHLRARFRENKVWKFILQVYLNLTSFRTFQRTSRTTFLTFVKRISSGENQFENPEASSAQRGV